MPLSISKRAVLIVLCIIGVYCSKSKRVLERIKHLESRFNTESKFRDEDYAEVIDRLDEIDKKLNGSLEKRVGFVNSDHGSGDVNIETINHLRKDFTKIWTEFRDEKYETARIRREIPKIKHDLEYYCTMNLNKTGELISRVEESDDVRKIYMEMTVNEIYGVKFALENTISNTSILVGQEFKGTVEEIEERIQRTVKKELKIMEDNTRLEIADTKANVERFEILVSQLSARVEQLFGYNSCSEAKSAAILRSGVYKQRQGLEVYCDQTTDGGGWLVFQRRHNGEVDFYRDWIAYKNGFGDLNSEFWLGNEHLSILTSSGDHELRIDMEDFYGNKAFAKYSKFKVYPEEDKYKLEVSGYSGNAGDSLKYHNGMAFTTFDNDNDKWSNVNCAEDRHGAWWYKSCAYSNLNGQHFNDAGKPDTKGIFWYYFKQSMYCLKSVEMKFR
ncbi:fibrinogen-like protein 1 [Mercenaria mercenaria]|uniref:fibrinogen-like protein 1 n=1 Tax=Mercenaria mercenaria TaxID=6596 RepID=UPI00234F35DA|nr:fibrinogen-like protein 1 [Mercenaria mercenaria]